MRDTDKAAALLWLLREGLPKKSPTLVFASTRHHVEYLTLLLSLEGVEVCAVHGSMDQVWVSLGSLGKGFLGEGFSEAMHARMEEQGQDMCVCVCGIRAVGVHFWHLHDIYVEYLTLLLSLEGVEVCAVHGSIGPGNIGLRVWKNFFFGDEQREAMLKGQALSFS